MNSKWWFRGSSGSVSCSWQTSVWRLRGTGTDASSGPCLGVDGRCSPDVCPGWPGAVCSHGPSLKPAYRCLLACVSLRRPPSVCVTGGCVRVTVCVYELPNLRSGPPLNGRPLGLRITGGSCVLGGPVKPRVCACAKGRSARSAAPPKNLTHH